MTICISAICTEKDKEHIVFAVDHMLSNTLGQFEHSITKYKKLNDNTVGMLSGDPLLMDYFMGLDCSNTSYNDIGETIKDKFKEKKLEVVKEDILDTYQVDFDFVRNILESPNINPISMEILKQVATAELNTALILAGFEGDKAKISEISESGIKDYTEINFHTIGSGTIQAMNTLLFQRHEKEDDLKTTIYNVFKAKKNAEVSRGVGKETDIGYLNNNQIILLKEEDLNILEKIYNIELVCGKNHADLNNLNI